MTWSVCWLCSSSRSFTSRFQIFDLTDICLVAADYRQILSKISAFSIATQLILVGSQIWNRAMKERLELHNLRTNRVTLWSELKYLIGVKVVMLQCRVFGGKTAHLQRVGFSSVKDHCNGSIPVPTHKRNCSSGLEPLLTLCPILWHNNVDSSLALNYIDGARNLVSIWLVNQMGI